MSKRGKGKRRRDDGKPVEKDAAKPPTDDDADDDDLDDAPAAVADDTTQTPDGAVTEKAATESTVVTQPPTIEISSNVKSFYKKDVNVIAVNKPAASLGGALSMSDVSPAQQSLKVKSGAVASTMTIAESNVTAKLDTVLTPLTPKPPVGGAAATLNAGSNAKNATVSGAVTIDTERSRKRLAETYVNPESVLGAATLVTERLRKHHANASPASEKKYSLKFYQINLHKCKNANIECSILFSDSKGSTIILTQEPYMTRGKCRIFN